jgi:RNA polymerase sigma-70 factor (ECF subfamily)
MSRDNKYIQKLLSEARSGSQTSMGRLAVIAWERLYPFVLRTTFNHDITEDILQETLLAIVQQIASLRECQRFWPWVYRIAWSKIQDTLRRRRRLSSTKTLLFQNRYYGSETKIGGDNLLDVKIREETLQQVSASLEQLSHRHRDVIHLRYYEQMPYAQIASLTQTTPEKVRGQFYQAKKTLKDHLLACCIWGNDY